MSILNALTAYLGYKAADKASDAGNAANDANLQIAQQNFDAQQAARDELIAYATQLMEEGRQGQTDIYGNRTYFDPERGWVTDLSPPQRLLADNIEQEQLRQSSASVDRAAGAEGRATGRAIEAGNTAEMLNNQFNNIERERVGPLADLIAAAGQGERNRTQDRLYGNIRRDLVRTGNTGALPGVLAERAERDASAAQDRGTNALLTAMGLTEQRYNTRRRDASSLYDSFARGAGYTPNADLRSPTGPAPNKSGEGHLFNALASGAPQQSYISPNYSDSNKYYDLANLAQTTIGNFQSQQRYDDLLDRMMPAGGTV